MAEEKRDLNSHARLFIPTHTERSERARRKKLKEDLQEVEKLKKELQDLIKEAKKK